MKKIIMFLFLVLIAVPASASTWYLVNSDNIVFAKQNGPLTQLQQDAGNYISVKAEEDIPLPDAEYRNGKIVLHKKTTKEISDESKAKARAEEEAKINLEMKRQAFEALKASGVSFKEITDEDFK